MTEEARVFDDVDDLLDYVFRESSPSTLDSRFDVSRSLTVVPSPMPSPSILDSRFDVSRPLTVAPSPLASPVREMSEEKVLRKRAPQSAGQEELEYNPLLDYDKKMKRKEYEWIWTRLSKVGDRFWVIAEALHCGFINKLEDELFPRDSEIEDLQLKAGQVILDVGRAMTRYPNEDIGLDRIDHTDRFEEEPSVLPAQRPMLKPKKKINSSGYEQLQIEREEARKKYNKAFELRKEKEKRKATEERLASEAQALASHPETRRREVFPFLREPEIKRPEEPTEKPQEPTLDAMAEEPHCLIASRDYHASYRKATAKKDPSSLKQSVIQRPALKMMVEEPHCAKAKDMPPSPQMNFQEEMIEEKIVKPVKTKYCGQEIVAFNSDSKEFSEEAEKPLVMEKPHWPAAAANRKRKVKRCSLVEDELPDAGCVLYNNNLSLRENNDLLDQQDYDSLQRNSQEEVIKRKIVKPLKAKYFDQGIVTFNSDHDESSEEAEKPVVVEKPHCPTLDELVTRAKASQEANEEGVLRKLSPQSVGQSLDRYSAECLEDEEGFIRRFLDGEEFAFPLDSVADGLQDFYDKKGQYLPKKHFAFEDVLLGMPDDRLYSYGPSPRVGLPAEFDTFNSRSPFVLTHCRDPDPFQDGAKSTRLGRIGGQEVISKEPTAISELTGEHFHRDFTTRGRLTPLINQSVFLKRRMDQDFTAVFNEHFKGTPEDQIPQNIPWTSASGILDQQLRMFSNQIDRRNALDQEAALQGFVPASRLETNVIESERQRRKNQAEAMISKRAPELDDERRRQMDRKRQNKIDSRARQKAEKEAARLKSRF